MDLVSVIIPCYNVASFIEACLLSVINQTYRNLEIIIVDNNSTDRTLEIATSYRNKCNRIKIFKETKQGAPAARNKGLQNSTGSWVQFMDADDYLANDKIAHQMMLIKQNSSAELIIGSAYNLYPDGSTRKFTLIPENFYKALIYSHVGYTSSNFFKRNVLEQVGGWNENLNSNQDLDITFRIFELIGNHKVIYDEHPKSYHRVERKGQISSLRSLEHRKSSLAFKNNILEYLKANHRKCFQTNQDYFIDAIYYYIYALGLISPSDGLYALKRLLPDDYRPIAKKDNNITSLHEWGVKVFGFKSFWLIRGSFLKK